MAMIVNGDGDEGDNDNEEVRMVMIVIVVVVMMIVIVVVVMMIVIVMVIMNDDIKGIKFLTDENIKQEQEKEIQKQLKQKDMHDEMNEFLNFSPNKPKRNRQIANRNNNNNNNEEGASSSLSSSEGSHHHQQNVSGGGGQQFLQRRPSLTGEKRLNDFIQKPGRITQVLLVDTNTNEMHIRRSNIVHEMYDTENNYVTSLRILIEVSFSFPFPPLYYRIYLDL